MVDLKTIGSPRARQIHPLNITETVIAMHREVRVRRGWYILYESTVTDNPYDNYPDVVIFDEYNTLQFSMEITRKWGMSYDKKKCLQLKQRFPWAEFFIYNYETDVLYALGDDGQWYNSKEYEVRKRFVDRFLTAGIEDNMTGTCLSKCLSNSETDAVTCAGNPCILAFQ